MELEPHRRRLWALAYRLTGDASLAEDLVQEAFKKTLEQPPREAAGDLLPWLVRVTTNLGHDALRRRRRRAYAGPWLPEPVPQERLLAAVADEKADAEARSLALESLSFTYLRALEALSPHQRAVLILRDVVGYQVDEVASALGLTPANVRVLHHRARARLAQAPERLRDPGRAQAALVAFLTALAAGDARAMEALLADDARLVNDGGGEFHAALRPVTGRERVIRFYLGVAELRAPEGPPATRFVVVNGEPALLAEWPGPRPQARLAGRFVTGVTLEASGLIAELWSVLATAKLRSL